MLAGDIKLLYVAPERLITLRFLDLLDRLRDDGKSRCSPSMQRIACRNGA